MSTNDVDDSDSCHCYSGIENGVTYEVEHKEASNEDEQMEAEELPPEADIDIAIQIQTARTAFKEKSLRISLL